MSAVVENTRLDEVLATACRGLPMTPHELRIHLAPEDMTDIEAGRITAEFLRGYAVVWCGDTLEDDRHRCRDCAHLALDGVCCAAARIEAPARYTPHPHVLRRCPAFTAGSP